MTLYLDVNEARDPVPDVSAVYLVMPTEANVSRVAEDAGRKLYRAMHLNFASPLPRPLLDLLARESLRAGGVSQVHTTGFHVCVHDSM